VNSLEQRGYYKNGQPTELWGNDHVMQKIPSFKAKGFISHEDVGGMVQPLLEKDAMLGRAVPMSMPNIYLSDISSDEDEALDVLRKFRQNLPRYLSSPESMNESIVQPERKRTMSTLDSMLGGYGREEKLRGSVVEAIRRVAFGVGGGQVHQPTKEELITSTMYSDEQKGAVGAMASKAEKQ
jgi:hypothetical protein